jgi:6-phosphogluconolactonase/glucosamine-6-phosphate isomerase/deaminase
MAALTGKGHVSILADLTKAEDVARLVSELPQIDGFVCNAGITRRRPVSYVKEEELHEVFETNTFAAFTLTKSIMKAKKIVLIATGKNKAKAVYGLIKGPITEDMPCSILQKHPDCTVYVDEEAYSLVK